MTRPWLCAVLATLLLAPGVAGAADCAGTSTGMVPLTDLGPGTHKGAQGGLYPGGSNVRPPVHEAAGLALARAVVPRDASGVPSASGAIGFLSIGMSNTTQESQAFRALAQADPLRHSAVRFVDGAQGGQAAEDIATPDAPYWTTVDRRVADAGLTASQVQTVWLKQANRAPSGSFPDPALRLEADLRAIVQILRLRFPNLHLVYLSSRVYAGYASTALNPEPHAYESGFSVKWLVEAQIDGTYAAQDPARGVVAPWLSWGPYLWGDGLQPRGDGLVWACGDFQSDGTHPSQTGRLKVASMLLEFLHTDSTAVVWYVHGGSPPA